jgi:predicted negative regulator of RcsB-dependent stress response
MAKQLDLQEQEQIDALKAFWNQYGNLITWTLTMGLGAFALYNLWNMGERQQGLQASTLYAQLEDAANAGDVQRTQRVFEDMKTHRPWYMLPSLTAPPAYTQQGGLLLAKVQSDKGKAADALATLQWVAQNGNAENAAVARLGAAGVLADQKKYDEALKQLDAATNPAFQALVADRRGDILMAQGQRDAARSAYRTAFDAMPATLQYRVLVEAKLTALGAAPAASAASAAASGASR